MSTRSAFKSPAARHLLDDWFERFRARIGRPTESRTVPTRFGDTHVLVGGPVGAPDLVLLHGALASSAHVLHELAPLLERFRVHAVDIVGQSVKSADAPTPVMKMTRSNRIAESASTNATVSSEDSTGVSRTAGTEYAIPPWRSTIADSSPLIRASSSATRLPWRDMPTILLRQVSIEMTPASIFVA